MEEKACPRCRISSADGSMHSLQQYLLEVQHVARRAYAIAQRSAPSTESIACSDRHVDPVKADTDQQKKKNDVLLGELKKHGDSFEAFDSEHYAEAEAVENAYFKRVEELETEIQRSSERKLATKGYGIFGSTKAIRVEITLTADVSTFGNKLVMELGSVSSLAHAIELFLMLVEKKHFYDHLTLMHRSAGSSVINTIPMDSETLQIVSNNFVRGGSPVIGSVTNSEPIDVKKQDEIMLLQLAMLEQSVDYPIQKYSGEFSSFP